MSFRSECFFTSNCNFTLLDYTGLAISSDNCDPSPTISQSPLPGTIVTNNTLITLTATDDSEILVLATLI